MFELEFDHSGTMGRVESTCPERTEAGANLPWTVSFETSHWLERGGRLALARRKPSDWGIPQADDPTAADHFTVHTTSGAPLRWCNAYRLRVLQHDGAQAWSSPVFATFADAEQA